MLIFRCLAGMEHRIERVSKNFDNYYKCFICELFFKQYDLDLHFATFHETDVDEEKRKLNPSFEEFMCYICGEKFRTMNRMAQHIDSDHQGTFICCQNQSCTLQISHFCQSGQSQILDHDYHQSVSFVNNTFVPFVDKNISPRMKIIRKRCGECSGCQRRENCGHCPPCQNNKRHQICRNRICFPITN